MEMEEIVPEEREEEKGREQPETKVEEEKKEVEEEEESVYTKLHEPTEDIYAKPGDQPSARNRRDLQILGNVRVYRAVCFLLSLICLVLLLVIIILGVRLPTEHPACPMVEEDRSQPVACSLQDCAAQHRQLETCMSGPPCPRDWKLFEDSCYYLSRERRSWEESRLACQNRGGDLVVVTNDRVQSFLTQKGGLIYWIGLRNMAEKWTWVNHRALGKSYWPEGVGGGDCCTLVGKERVERSWDVSSCNYSSAYICQAQKWHARTLAPAAQG